jgi:uncharacterized protein YjdB
MGMRIGRFVPGGKAAFTGVALGLIATLPACNEHITRKIEARVVSLDLVPLLDTLEVGDSIVFLAAPLDASNNPLTAAVRFTSTQPGIASVHESSGKVLALTKGTAAIEASVGDITRGGVIVVISSADVATIAISPATPSVQVGSIGTLTAVAKNVTGDPVPAVFTWASANPAIATVNPSTGFVTGVAAGNTTVSASFGGVTATVPLTVTPTVQILTAIVVGPAAPSVQVGSTIALTATAQDVVGNPMSAVFTWTSANPSIATVNATTGVVTGVSAGSANVSAASGGVMATVPVTVTPLPVLVVDSIAPRTETTDPDFPAVFLTTTVASTPSSTRTINVSGSDNLQTVLDTAKYGDKIVLAAGASFTGNFVMPAKSGGTPGEWITIQGGATIPPEGTRVSPGTAANFPKLITNNVNPALKTAFGAARWRVIGIEITATTSLLENYGLVNLGDGDPSQNLVSEIASDLIFDRVYVHGQVNLDVKRCFGFNSARTALVDSYVSECHSKADAQAVGGWNGPGPYKIVGNYLEAAAEVIAFGGADPGVLNQIPSDMEIRRNHMTKPLSWKGTWLTKNLVEFKFGRRILIEANVIENSAVDAQDGSAFVIWTVNQNGGCTWCITEHLTIRNNLIRNTAAGFQMTARALDHPSPSMQQVAIRNNVLIGLGNPAVGTNGRIFLMQGIINSLTIENNTAFSPNNSSFVWGGQQPSASLRIRNNLTGGGQYQIFSPQGQGTAAWNYVAGPGSVFLGNVVALAEPANSPTGNFYPATLADIGLTGGAAAAYSVTASLTDLTLASSSTHKAKGTDGKDPGANLALIQAMTVGVVK